MFNTRFNIIIISFVFVQKKVNKSNNKTYKIIINHIVQIFSHTTQDTNNGKYEQPNAIDVIIIIKRQTIHIFSIHHPYETRLHIY